MLLADSDLVPNDQTILEWEEDLQHLIGDKPSEWLTPLEKFTMKLMATILVQSTAIDELREFYDI
jgi:hypothetical protein